MKRGTERILTTHMALKDIVDVLFQIKAGALSFEAANPRHEHEYHVFELD